MGLLYNFVDKGVSIEEVEQCLKRVKDLWLKLSDEFELSDNDFYGFTVSYLESNLLELIVRFDSRRVKLRYDSNRGVCTVVGKESQEILDDIGDVDVDSSKVRGYFFNIMKTIDGLQHKVCKIIIKQESSKSVSIYETKKEGSKGIRESIILVKGSTENIFSNFHKCAKIEGRYDISELSEDMLKTLTQL